MSGVQGGGRAIFSDPLRNRGVAFTHEEREHLGLVGMLPSAVLTLEQQAQRAYAQLKSHPTALARNTDLEQLHDRNEVLYYRLLLDHLTELLPIVYAPTVGEAIKRYSHEFRRARGVYLSIDRPQDIRRSFEVLNLGPEDVDLLVATDGEAILGIGDWGVGGMGISRAKLTVYTAAAGIHPGRVIPVVLDVGTDNVQLLNDPLYVGNRHSRQRSPAYDDFIDQYVAVITELFPHALIHWEDFGPINGRSILERYQKRCCTFNDDMQGTGVVALAAVKSALRVLGAPLSDERIVIFGAGTAGIGIADQLVDDMVVAGMDRADACRHFWCIDKDGLLLEGMPSLRSYHHPYARSAEDVAGWGTSNYDLETVVDKVHPTILIGCSAVHNAFHKDLVTTMATFCERPIIFPMSNPTERLEAIPNDLLQWTNGRAIVATGLPTETILYGETTFRIAQANNALMFPGFGLGIIVSRAKRVTDGMLSAAATAIASLTDATQPGAPILPPMEDLRIVSAQVAAAIIHQAERDGVAQRHVDDVVQSIQDAMWMPVYPTSLAGEK